MSKTQRGYVLRCARCGHGFLSPIGIAQGPTTLIAYNQPIACLHCGLKIDPGSAAEEDLPIIQPPLVKFDQKYKLVLGAMIDRSYRSAKNPSYSGGIGGVANTFVINMDRVLAILNTPVHLIGAGIVNELLNANANYDLAQQFKGPSQPTHSDFQSARKRVVAQFENLEDLSAGTHWRGFNFLDFRAGHLAPDLVMPLLAAQIIGAWTAVEALAEDLWMAAERRDHPGGSFPMAGHAKRIGDISDGLKGIPASAGASKLKRKEVKFASLSSIRSAYSAAFDHAYTDVDDALSNLALDALSAVRNVLVHNGGIADQDYIDKSRGVPNAPVASMRNAVNLDGETVCAIINPAVERAVRLIDVVDKWR